MALKWYCIALYTSGHKELRKRGETISCIFFLSGGCCWCSALLCVSSPRCTLATGNRVCPWTPWKDAISRCLYPLLHPIREQQLCYLKALSSEQQFSDWGTAKAKKCCKVLTEQNLAKHRSQHALLKSRKITMCQGPNNNLVSYMSL